MNDREALLAAIVAVPDDDTPRLVFADWLQENGEAEQAAFIREQCGARSATPAARRRWGPLVRRAARWFPGVPAEALRVSEANWVRDLDRPGPRNAGLVRALVRRGFVEAVACSLGFFLNSAADLFRNHPLREIVLTDRTAGRYDGERVDGLPPGRYVWASTELLPNPAIYYAIPPELLARIGRLGHGKPHPVTPTRWFDTDDAAEAGLSAACVAYGRLAAGLARAGGE